MAKKRKLLRLSFSNYYYIIKLVFEAEQICSCEVSFVDIAAVQDKNVMTIRIQNQRSPYSKHEAKLYFMNQLAISAQGISRDSECFTRNNQARLVYFTNQMDVQCGTDSCAKLKPNEKRYTVSLCLAFGFFFFFSILHPEYVPCVRI